MEREPVWYGDLDLAPPTPEQYHENLLWQIDREAPPGDDRDPVDPDTPTWALEQMIDTQNFIPLITDDYKLAFCQVTRSLPELCQTLIWSSLVLDDVSIPPPAPQKKKYKMSDRMKSHMSRWAARKQLSF
jgi:hypothetical protein